ncbi:hypothetical protein K502DRAFT_23042 [Neoconidiobolus thromboides FSU 785]|nr:hypothetical protein K502DRAFT_23042 [Neoconidiobolus thromboides FSU 785]
MSIQNQFDLAVEVNTRPTCFRAITTQKEKDDVTKLLDTFNRFYESIVDIHSGIYRMIFLTLEAYFKHGVIKTYPNYEKYIELIVKAIGKMIRCEDEVFNLYALRFIFILYEDYYDLIKVHIYILFKCLFFALNKDFYKVENYNASIGTCYQFLIYFMELEFMNNKELIFRYVESGFSIKCPNLRLRYVFLLEYIIKLADDDFIEMNHMKIDQMIIKSFDDKALLIRQAGSIVYHSYCRKNVNRAYELYQSFNTNQKRNTRCKTNRALHQHVIRRPKIYSAYLKDAEIPNVLEIIKKHILPHKRELEHKKRISQYEEENTLITKKVKLEMYKKGDSDVKTVSDTIQSLSPSKSMFKQFNVQIKGIFEKFVADNVSLKDGSISPTHFTSTNQNESNYKNTQRMSSDRPNSNERKIDQGGINGEKNGHGVDGKIKITVKKGKII